MATIDDLTQSISEMEETDVMSLFMTIRLARRTAPPKKKKKEKTAKVKKQIDPTQAIIAMTPEQAEELLKQLGG